MTGMPLIKALPLSQALINLIKDFTVRCEIAGSVRRKKEIVKDIELVARVEDYEGLYRQLAHAGRFIKPGVPGVIDWPPKPGAKYVRMMLNDNIKLDMFITTPDNWGGIFTMRTGSGVGTDGNPYNGFVPRLFSKWKRMSGGGRMVGGQPTMPDGTMLSVPEEQDFFDLCGAVWIPPEERIHGNAVKSNRVKTCR